MSFPVEFPSYIVDSRVVKAVMRNNARQIKVKHAKDRFILHRLFFWEVEPVKFEGQKFERRVYVFPLLGFAILYRSMDVISLILKYGGDVYQRGVILNERTHEDGGPLKYLQEVNCLTLIEYLFSQKHYEDVIRLFVNFLQLEVDLFHGFEIRYQITHGRLVQDYEMSMYINIFKYLEHKMKPQIASGEKSLEKMLGLVERVAKKQVTLSKALELHKKLTEGETQEEVMEEESVSTAPKIDYVSQETVADVDEEEEEEEEEGEEEVVEEEVSEAEKISKPAEDESIKKSDSING